MTSQRQEPAVETQEAHLFVCRREKQAGRLQNWLAQALSLWYRAEKVSEGFQSLDPQ